MQWHTTLGIIKIVEQCFLKQKKRYRPFLIQAKVYNKSCSLKMKRVICDFGIDCSFYETSKKIKEHYDIDICVDSIRKVTEKYAQYAKLFNENYQTKTSLVSLSLIAEGDGSMVPIVEIEEGEGDRRKRRNISWKEFKLGAIQKKDTINWFYAISRSSIDDFGDALEKIALRSGFGEGSEVHALGDGAPWIIEQMERVFGCQMTYTIDFFHLCEYFSPVSEIFKENKDQWMEETKEKLKKGKIEEVLSDLKKLQKAHQQHEDLKKCIGYIEKRDSQFAYDKASEKGLPIGSGKIESSHRHIIQKRMKKPGAWWRVETALDIINFRILREHGDWERFWEKESKKKAA